MTYVRQSWLTTGVLEHIQFRKSCPALAKMAELLYLCLDQVTDRTLEENDFGQGSSLPLRQSLKWIASWTVSTDNPPSSWDNRSFLGGGSECHISVSTPIIKSYIFHFTVKAFYATFKKFLLPSILWRFSPVFSSRSFKFFFHVWLYL